MDRGAWWARVQRVAKSQTRLKLLSTHARRVTTCVYCSEFVPSLAEGHLGCFQDWTSMSQSTSVQPFV